MRKLMITTAALAMLAGPAVAAQTLIDPADAEQASLVLVGCAGYYGAMSAWRGSQGSDLTEIDHLLDLSVEYAQAAFVARAFYLNPHVSNMGPVVPVAEKWATDGAILATRLFSSAIRNEGVASSKIIQAEHQCTGVRQTTTSLRALWHETFGDMY